MYTIATLIPAHPNFEQMMLFSAVGFMVVLVVLMFLSLMTSIIGKFFALAAKNAPAAKPAAPKPQAVSAAPEIPQAHMFAISAAVAAIAPEFEDEKTELLAVLTAAAAAVLGEECRVVSATPIAPDMSFARQGRMQIFASKNYTPQRNK